MHQDHCVHVSSKIIMVSYFFILHRVDRRYVNYAARQTVVYNHSILISAEGAISILCYNYSKLSSTIIYHLAHSVLNVINASLPPIPVCVVFPQVLFLVPYFSLYNSPLSTLISYLSLNHHLYADDTQFFSLSMHLIFFLISLTFLMLYNTSPPG